MSGADEMERALSRRLRSLDDTGRMRVARDTLEQLEGHFAPEVCALLLEELDGVKQCHLGSADELIRAGGDRADGRMQLGQVLIELCPNIVVVEWRWVAPLCQAT